MATGTHKLIGNVDITLSLENMHWGYFSKTLTPVLESGSEVIVEMATHNACDDWIKMSKGHVGIDKDIYPWNNETIFDWLNFHQRH